MLVERIIWNIKPGHVVEFGALLKATEAGLTNAVRVYQIRIGEADRIALEMEHGSMEERERWWNEWRTSDEAAAWAEKSTALRERGTTHEFWDLLE